MDNDRHKWMVTVPNFRKGFRERFEPERLLASTHKTRVAAEASCRRLGAGAKIEPIPRRG